MTQTRQWFVKVNDRTAGPLSDGKVVKLASAGKITPETQIRADDGPWVPAGELGWIFATEAKPEPEDAGWAKHFVASGEVPDEPTVSRPPMITPENRQRAVRVARASSSAAFVALQVFAGIVVMAVALAITGFASVGWGPSGFIAAMSFWILLAVLGIGSQVGTIASELRAARERQ